MKEEFDILFAEYQKLLGELQAMSSVKRTWVGLTDEEVENLCLSVGAEPIEVRLIEAKLKERNT